MHGQILVHDPVGRRRGHPRGSGLVESAAQPSVYGLLEIVVLVFKLAHTELAEVLVPMLVRADDPVDILRGELQVNGELPAAEPVPFLGQGDLAFRVGQLARRGTGRGTSWPCCT